MPILLCFVLRRLFKGLINWVYWHKYQPLIESISLAKTTETIPESLIIAPKEILAVFSKELPTSKPIKDDLWHSVPRPITLPSSSDTEPDSIIFFVLFQTCPDIIPERENWMPLIIKPIKYPATTLIPKPKPMTSGNRRVCINNKLLLRWVRKNTLVNSMQQHQTRRHNQALNFLAKCLHLT